MDEHDNISPSPAKPGDIVNGHILDSEGNWLPLNGIDTEGMGPVAERKRKRRWPVIALAVVVLIAALAGLSFVASSHSKAAAKDRRRQGQGSGGQVPEAVGPLHAGPRYIDVRLKGSINESDFSD